MKEEERKKLREISKEEYESLSESSEREREIEDQDIEKYDNICEFLFNQDDERIEVGPNGEYILPFIDVDIALVDGDLILAGEGLEDYKHLQSYLGDRASYSFNEVIKRWTITIEGEKDRTVPEEDDYIPHHEITGASFTNGKLETISIGTEEGRRYKLEIKSVKRDREMEERLRTLEED